MKAALSGYVLSQLSDVVLLASSTTTSMLQNTISSMQLAMWGSYLEFSYLTPDSSSVLMRRESW